MALFKASLLHRSETPRPVEPYAQRDLTRLTPPGLLALHARIMDELRLRGITRSANSPTGDLAEYLFCKAFGWKQAGNSSANVDAIAPDGTRYQIKGRRLTRHNGSRQLSAIRDLGGGHFDVLAAVLFSADYGIQRAALIPHAVVVGCSAFVSHTNSHRFLLRDQIWDTPGVEDVTEKLRAITWSAAAISQI